LAAGTIQNAPKAAVCGAGLGWNLWFYDW